ncbi:hypothetical protein OPV22_004898 [Ensete ventricosum]|uniref:RRM domain-containing protein n=1 Tax=Ensete ventricosum TaxID=4639 RepID=A0AAV8PZU2_ENSVE|nr:hypothetical protein OPV22_004898 [Ensete ventricosum]
MAAVRSGFRRLFSISAFSPPPPAAVAPSAEPSTNLFVSGLSKRTTSEGLMEAFQKFGQVIHARVVTDRVSGYSKGFGFVRYATLAEAAEGIKGMDGKFLDGWVIFAESAASLSDYSASDPANRPLHGVDNTVLLELEIPEEACSDKAQQLKEGIDNSHACQWC